MIRSVLAVFLVSMLVGAAAQACEPGYEQLNEGQCTPCPAGKYHITGGEDTTDLCEDCPPGLDSNAGAASCGCPDGFFAPAPGSEACVPCPSGTFSDEGINYACKECSGEVNAERTACDTSGPTDPNDCNSYTGLTGDEPYVQDGSVAPKTGGRCVRYTIDCPNDAGP